ncbi:MULTISPECIES: ABC transporter substrate-binding protein [unclassified Streptococcus]|uniref:ABC transporter substrate-binding protein n=1 Tax=unclassified Streptococcus TaxID=2608887 RepID=UPI001071CE1B|nr:MULTISPECIES: ABC transporter substrate-binding protein [unclassified Streptococcus]MBF0786893.1 ABC transporter substrate-binding protein [Streptococcus sp. 19428wC2_LYSM12]MCQ9212695.1 ABC transporter substrate-binding protein [Streptococcus sp. B01]MCQ9214036.1 ABC transporter substrate-binding protein [Streptococcus sp. O1]TFV06261.1 ABC transporter substrate-binding protein [Streptococcus sp. LYSM12]
MGFKQFFTGSVAVLSTLALVACSSGDKSASSDDENVKIGIIQYAEHDALSSARKGFLEALDKAGYTEGKNLVVDYQNAQGDQANLQTMVEQLAGKNDVNFAIATPAAQALLSADNETASLFTAVSDPVAAGLVDSLKRPGGNMTGTTDSTDVAGQIEKLLKVVPTAKTIGIFHNSSEINSEVQAKEAKKLLEEKGLKVVVKTVTSTNDVQQAITSLAGQVDAIYLPLDNTVASTASTIGDVLLKAKVPAIGSDEAVLEATLFTYGVDFHAIGMQAGELAVSILKGEKPADLAVKTPETAAIAVNEEMAKAVGIDPEMIKELEQ